MSMRILSVDGGGYLGLATAAFIAGVERHLGVRFHDRFDLFCGSSTGAILAVGLATGKSGAEMVEIYRRWGPRIFARGARWQRWLRYHSGLLRPKYGNAALAMALQESYGDLTLADLGARGKRAVVTAFCTTTGHPRIFKTDRAGQPTAHSQYLLRDVVLASSAAPTYFPLVRIVSPFNNAAEVFCDGGVVANHPALVGYAEAVADLHTPPGDVQLLSLATPQTDLSEPVLTARDLQRGLWGWRSNLAAILIHSNAQISHQILRRIANSYGTGGPLYERVVMHNRERFAIDRVDEATTQGLIAWGTAVAESEEVRGRVARFFDPAFDNRGPDGNGAARGGPASEPLGSADSAGL